ncbi:MAG TPA: glycosyltransferase family 39 protein [Caulobacteraceae bacterium]|nr:glycosyltransferase family 39 protein [Caulobacteraceae bacterium]
MTRPPRSLLVFLLAVTLGRLAAAAFIPLGEDEAYYRLWAQHLQLGYLDHPPMIALWVRAGMTLAGDNALGVRLASVLSTALASLLVFDLASRIGLQPRAAVRAAIWFNATLLIGIGGILAVPDAPNILFWTATLACLARTDGQGGWRWWLAAGMTAGLASLSKYSALFLAPGVLLWLALKPGGWRALTRPWPWAAALIAAGLFGLNVSWNATHHWVTFVKQFGRAAPRAFAPENLLWLILSQIVLINPSIGWFAGRGAGLAWRWRKAKDAPDVGLVLWTAAPFLAYLLIHALHDRVEAHWPAPLYAGFAVLAAWAAEAAPEKGYLAGMRARAAPIGLVLAALVLVHLAAPATDFGPDDPAQGFRGWPDLATRVEAARVAAGASWVGALSYGVAAELAATRRIKAPIVEVRERDRYPPGDGSWTADLGQPGLVVDEADRMRRPLLGDCFTLLEPRGDLARGDPGKPGQTYSLVRVQGIAPGAQGDCDRLARTPEPADLAN